MHPDAVHVVPCGQQCTRSEQQTAFGRGQQPYSPEANRQHVFPVGHCTSPPGQTTFGTFSKTKILNQVTSNITICTEYRINVIIKKNNLSVDI